MASPSGRGTNGSADPPRVAGVTLSHSDRVLYPEQGLTKLDLLRYYQRLASRILPHLRDRPLSLVRCPRGRQAQCFYQKHATADMPPSIGRVEVQEEQGPADYVEVHSLAGLAQLVQIGALELHPGGARRDNLERPDRLVFDLDPGPEVEWQRVVQTAHRLRERLSELGLTTFAKTSGGKGLHLMVPLVRRWDWDAAKRFALAVAEELACASPDLYTTNPRRAERRGRIFLDYLRNTPGATTVAPYSPRARAGAPVSTPLRWEEVTENLASADLTVLSIPERLAADGTDPWRGFFDLRQSLTRRSLRELGLNP